MAISFYAADTRDSHLLYLIGHLLGGLFYLIFAYKFFYLQQNSGLLLVLAVGGVISEWVQAIIPAKRELFKYHNFFAWSMGLFMSLILIVAPFIGGLDYPGIAALSISLLILISCILITLKFGIKKFWLPQMVYFFSFYVVMALLAV